mmetsp:Transcript_57180/g.66851  ORF Transcript_57180/g.66851 Transcript_57180/m.66851 type:complete len:398 (-) Transcript_57180:260-1453(-)|eukprot:CAMPEP_0194381532 /NCGR_PEP_ID=MMETSP0174-20130528/53849_1 /TAXON_ID=216777 /ORGANISM="Proboscia alata, Strain PI-D3" /LENGTH=397 /DNA_ID=CAMNT_0039165985 /DNA_START=129 /DNA_END=1322 /DNA_ORIENTATION=+
MLSTFSAEDSNFGNLNLSPLVTFDVSDYELHDEVHQVIIGRKIGECNEKHVLSKDHIEPIVNRNWAAVVSWAVFSPEEVANLRHKEGHNALHYACLYLPPPRVIEILLFASNELALSPNNDGEIPIHWACLVSVPDEVLSILLEASPNSGCICNKKGETAISLLWDRYGRDLRKAVDSSVFAPPKAERIFWSTNMSGWRKILLVLQASYRGSPPPMEGNQITSRYILHAAVSNSSCPLELIQLILILYPDQIAEKNESGMLPLTIVAKAQTKSNDPTRLMVIINALLDYFPSAARIQDKRQTLPLNLALQSGKTWQQGVKSLFNAEPRALLTRDASTKMFPFMIASAINDNDVDKRKVGNETNLNSDDDSLLLGKLNTTYELLLASPECIRTVTPNK